jgi:hypothetical protein
MCFSSPALYLVQVEESVAVTLSILVLVKIHVFLSTALYLVQVEESGGRDPLHPRAGQNICVFNILLFT